VPKIDLIIPTYNGRDHLRVCLQAVRDQSFSDVNVIVVDDGSTDDTAAMVTREFPNVALIELTGNHGFAAACNAGIEAGSAEFIALLNNDAIPEREWLGGLVDAMQRYPSAGALASKILLADGSGRIHSAGDTFSWSGLPNSRGVWELDHGQYDTEDEVFSACAAAALYRRSALEEASLITGAVLEPDFFMYCEDIDLAWRLRLLGYLVVYIPHARVTHHLSATGGGSLASFYVARNSFAVLTRNLPEKLQRRVWPRFAALQALQLIKALAHLREPAARAHIRGILAGPQFARTQHNKRRAIQAAKRVSRPTIEALLSR
jgi:GT2 family glycosyltransferase